MRHYFDQFRAWVLRRKRRRQQTLSAKGSGSRPRLQQQPPQRNQTPQRKQPPRRPQLQPRQQQPLRTRVASSLSALLPALVPDQEARAALPKTAVTRRRRTVAQPVTTTAQMVRDALRSTRLISFVFLALTVWLLWQAGQVPHLFAFAIPVEGNSYLSRTAIVEQSGLAGQHLFEIDLAAAQARVAAIPGVLSADIHHTWPHQPRIVITEDTPVAIWRENGRDFQVNRQGALLPIDLPGQPLPLIVATLSRTAPGLPLSPDDPDFAARPPSALGFVPAGVLENVQAFTRQMPEINSFAFDQRHGLRLRDPRGWEVWLGTDGESGRKLAAYDALVNNLAAQGITPAHIDLSNPERLYYKPASQGQ
jgi:hypothetical protein